MAKMRGNIEIYGIARICIDKTNNFRRIAKMQTSGFRGICGVSGL